MSGLYTNTATSRGYGPWSTDVVLPVPYRHLGTINTGTGGKSPTGTPLISATTIPEDYHINVIVLYKLIQCRDGILSLLDDLSSNDDIAQLIALICIPVFVYLF